MDYIDQTSEKRSEWTNKTGRLNSNSVNSWPLLNRRYRVGKCLAEGTFSQLFCAQDSVTNEIVAIKFMNIKYAFVGIQVKILFIL